MQGCDPGAVQDDNAPLAYVVALDFARRQPGRRYLDFGSGAILFARHGFDVALADISSTLLRFCQWRLARRSLSGQIIDLKDSQLAPHAWDIVTAMDVFEHLTDPVGAVHQLADALTPGGYLFGRFAAEPDEDRPQHIVPTSPRSSSVSARAASPRCGETSALGPPALPEALITVPQRGAGVVGIAPHAGVGRIARVSGASKAS